MGIEGKILFKIMSSQRYKNKSFHVTDFFSVFFKLMIISE